MIGYFGGYISKKQKLGRFELKQALLDSRSSTKS